MDEIADPAAILEDSGEQTINLSGISTVGQSPTITAESDNPDVIPDPTVV